MLRHLAPIATAAIAITLGVAGCGSSPTPPPSPDAAYVQDVQQHTTAYADLSQATLVGAAHWVCKWWPQSYDEMMLTLQAGGGPDSGLPSDASNQDAAYLIRTATHAYCRAYDGSVPQS